MVPKRDYNKTDIVIINEMEKNTIDMNTPDKFRRLRMINANLANTNLLTMVTGQRKRPIVTEQNIHGYSSPSFLNIPPSPNPQPTDDSNSTSEKSEVQTIVLEADDLFHYIYDNKRLYTLV